MVHLQGDVIMAIAETLPQLKVCKYSSCSNIAISWDGVCKEHAGRRSLRSYSERPKPRTSDCIGVEMEMFNPQSVYQLTPVARFVCADGSLDTNGAGEVKLCSTPSRIAAIAADTAQRARLGGADVNRKCGFHVHMSLPSAWHSAGYDDRTAMRIRLNNFAKTIEDKFFDIMPPSRRSNAYCQRLSSVDMTSHYAWLSLSRSVPTIEIRLHGGTTNPWKVKAWIEFCIALRKRIHDVILGVVDEYQHAMVDSLADICKYGSLAYKYIKAREASPCLEKFGF